MDSSDIENIDDSPQTVLLKVMNRFANKCEEVKQKEIITRVGRDYRVVPEANDEMAEEIALLQEILMRQEQTYHNDVEDYKIQIENICEEIQKYEDLKKDVNEKMKLECEKEKEMKNIMQEYEKTVENLCLERLKMKEKQELENKSITQDLFEHRSLLSAEEKKFADLHKAYEQIKAKRDNYEEQKMQLEYQISHAKKVLEQKEKGYQSLEELTKKELERASRELNTVRQSHQIECAKLKGYAKKLDLQIESLEQMLQQQLKENKELTAIYDDCLNKIGTDKEIKT